VSQENLNTLRGLYERWAAGDWTDNSIFDPDVVGVFPDPSPQAHYGLNALAGYMRRFLESWDDMRMEATDYREAGDTFVVRVRRSATGTGSGVPLEDHAFHVWTFRGQKAIRMELFDRESEALEAAGLRE
jgi:ketosteroid isomerase-like protein